MIPNREETTFLPAAFPLTEPAILFRKASARAIYSFSTQLDTDPAVNVNGLYADGSYHMTFRRPLSGNKGVSLEPGSQHSVAFAIWDGSAGDDDNKKSFTIWHQLTLAP
jgi:DMSO reductase family type II enzyme heme b subunit